MKNKIYIILPVHNRKEITLNFLESLTIQSYKNWVLILVDDGSVDMTDAACKKLIPESIILKGDGNLWWAGSLQMGIDYLKQLSINKDDAVLFINDDTQLPTNFLSIGLNHLIKTDKTLLLAIGKDKNSKLDIEIGSKIIWPFFKVVPAKSDEEINCAPTRGLFLKWQDVIEIGDFIPNKLPHYCSDYEFTVRALKKGFKIETRKDFFLFADYSTTGYHQIQAPNIKIYLSKLFSEKSAKNPWTISKFICLSAPIQYVIPGILKVWLGTLVRFITFLFKGNHA